MNREKILEIASILQDLAQELREITESYDGTERKFYSISEAARILGVHTLTIWKKARSGEIPTIRVGKKYLIPAGYLYHKKVS